MKKTLSILSMLFVMSVFAPQLLYAQQQAGPPGPGWYCPNRMMGGGYGRMGQGMGAGMGQGMGRGMCRGMGPAVRLNAGKPLTEDQAKLLLQNYIASREVAGLKLGAISDKGNLFEAVITNNSGVPVEKVQVDKKTGWFKNIPS
ncbi:MAG: hypothetical protein ACP5SH_05315 [Syntrophobacteraceae bacterium]